MMRVFWEEWRVVGRFSFLNLLPILAAAVAAFLLLTQFQPGALFVALAAMALVGGSISGTQRWNTVPAWVWVGTEDVSPLAYTLGKVAGFLLILVTWIAFVLPPLLLVSLLWGLPWQVLATSLVWVLAGGLAAQALAHVVTWGESDYAKLIVATLVLSWLIASLQHPLTRGLNPCGKSGTCFANLRRASTSLPWVCF